MLIIENKGPVAKESYHFSIISPVELSLQDGCVCPFVHPQPPKTSSLSDSGIFRKLVRTGWVSCVWCTPGYEKIL